ncbi:MAG: aminotransferase class III-fold pyridoxal phosphate-dependent enzyme, partial [Pseudomonadota bacterium]
GFQKISDNTAPITRVIDRGEGIYVYDTDGREYIEATASFYVACLGYQNAELIDAIEKQYRDLPFFVSALHRTNTPALELAEKLVEIVPVADSHIMFGVSGSEALDYLIKMLRFGAVARGEPERKTIIGRQGSYHGGTVASASLTGGHHEEFGLPIEGFRHVSQCDYHGHREPGETQSEYSKRCGEELRALLDAEPEASVAAFFAEPISFSNGFKVPPMAYFPAIKAVLDDYGIDLAIDEVITGFGRTGNMFGCESFDIKPDHIATAKAVNSGYFPLSAIAMSKSLYDDLERGSEDVGVLAHAATHAGHPVGAAAALKTLEIIERDNLVAHAASMGSRLANALESVRGHELVGDIRSFGLGSGVDFLKRDDNDVPVNTPEQADAVMSAVCEAMLEAGVIVRPAGRSIVIAPPLIIEGSEIDEIVRRLVRSLDRVAAQH